MIQRLTEMKSSIKFGFVLLFVATAVSVFAQEGQPVDLRSKIVKTIDGKKFYMHIVEKGQTLYGIAQIYNSSVSDIIMDNPEAINGVRYGMVLRVLYEPNNMVKVSPEDKIEGNIILHTVEQGETLYSIARKYNTSVAKINEMNNFTTEQSNLLRADQVIKIPKPASFIVSAGKPDVTPTNEMIKVTLAESDVIEGDVIVHSIEKGESMTGIAQRYTTSIEKILLLNKMSPEQADVLKIGQKVKIPKPASLSSPVVKSTTTNTIAPSSPMGSVPVKQAEVKPTIVKASPPAPVNSVNAPETSKESLMLSPTPSAKFGYPGEQKEEYRIAFFLPFHTNETINMDVEKLLRNEQQFSMKTKISLDFYEGALLAIDSLKKQHLNAKVFVYDIDDNDSLGVPFLLKNPEISEMDLIIGPLFSSGFMPVAKFAKEHSIPIVSPFIQANKILFDNPYVCKVTSSNSLQIVQMANFVVDSFHTQNVILINSGHKKESELCDQFKKIAKETVLNKMYDMHDSIKEAKGIPGIVKYLDSTRLNIIVLPSNNQAYVTECINTLHTHEGTYKFVVFGLQSWMDYDNLDFDYLNSLSLHIVSNNFIDYHAPETKDFLRKFSRTYNSFPDIYAFSGYDITYYFVSLLQKHGGGFLNEITDNDYDGLISNMQFIKSTSSKSGFENRYVLMLNYKNYELKPVN